MEQLKILNKQYMYQEILNVLRQTYKDITFNEFILIISVLD